PPPGVEWFDLKVAGGVVLDAASRALLPELARLAESVHARGGVNFTGRLVGDADGARLSGSVDAGKLALTVGEVVAKPAGHPATVRVQLSMPADLSLVQVPELSAEVGAATISLVGEYPLLGDGPISARLAVKVPALEKLAELSPLLATCKLAGGAEVELTGSRRQGRNIISFARLTARNARGSFRGKPCRLDGTIELSDVTWTRRSVTVGRAATESLAWAVGSSGGFVAADLSGLPERAAGTAKVVCHRVDLPELMRWAAPQTPLLNPAKLTPADRKSLTARADKLLGNAGELFRRADLRIVLKADTFRTFDTMVRAFYEVRDLKVRATVKAGKVNAGYRCGLNGGGMDFLFDVDLNQPRPRLATRAELD
ncbi:hypothetical protein LCGC14_2969920, partial [marine sediment metagenome]